jgi:hypothetical protein
MLRRIVDKESSVVEPELEPELLAGAGILKFRLRLQVKLK